MSGPLSKVQSWAAIKGGYVDTKKSPGNRIDCHIENLTNEKLYVAAFFFSADGERSIFPLAGHADGAATHMLEARRSIASPCKEGEYVLYPEDSANFYRSLFGEGKYVDVIVVLAATEEVRCKK